MKRTYSLAVLWFYSERYAESRQDSWIFKERARGILGYTHMAKDEFLNVENEGNWELKYIVEETD